MLINEISVKNQVCSCYFNNSIEAKNIETKNILIDEKNYMVLVINFARYVQKKVDKNN